MALEFFEYETLNNGMTGEGKDKVISETDDLFKDNIPTRTGIEWGEEDWFDYLEKIKE